jgi:2-oxoglutarate dehydrogenase complex dehydrogenase (E1) component-like enzyme
VARWSRLVRLVNGDRPQACVRATRLGFQFRQRFHKNVVIDMLWYGKLGPQRGAVLQLAAEDNLQVVVPSTPAQCFHVLRQRPFASG